MIINLIDDESNILFLKNLVTSYLIKLVVFQLN
jgi:hypothetical protein